jgi:tripartite-type tricarboxylate transporter receptor subunit TctC
MYSLRRSIKGETGGAEGTSITDWNVRAFYGMRFAARRRVSCSARRNPMNRALVLLVVLLLPGAAAADSFPEKPARFIVGFTPGGPSDIIARALGQKLSDLWSQQVVVENRPGAGGNIAAEAAARSAPDGYTWLLGNNSILATNQTLYARLAYDPVKDFAPVALVAVQPNILVVNPGVPAGSVKELIALAKAKPGALNYASSGSGAAAHLAAELFKTMAGVDMVHVPYKGAQPALTDVIAGQAQLMFATSASVIPYIKAGRLRALAVTTAQRSATVPDLPTVSEAGAESGLRGFEAVTWHGVVVPRATPGPLVERLNADIVKALAMRDLRERLGSLGAELAPGTPRDFAEYIAREIPKWAKVVKDSGARAE